MASPTKTCTQCGETKAVTDFHKAGKYRKSRCAHCTRLDNRSYRESKTADELRFQSIKYNYGLTREQYIDLALDQDFRCPICTEPLDFSGKLAVDHDHETGVVRGILDYSCNTALGKFKDNIATLSRAQAYLEANSASA
jgi:hypothetical protein